MVKLLIFILPFFLNIDQQLTITKCLLQVIWLKNSFGYLFSVDDLVPQGNPFKMPAEVDIFVLRDKERQRKKQVSSFQQVYR